MEIIDSQKFRVAAKKGLSGGYLFFGEEEYLKHSCLDIARKSVLGENMGDSFNHIRFDSDNFSHAELENAIVSLPVFSEKKLIEVHTLPLGQYKEKQLSELLEILSLLPDNDHTVLIIYTNPYEFEKVDMRRPSKMFTALAEHLTAVAFEKQSKEKLSKWICAHFAHNKVECSYDMCRLLMDTCGTDMYALSAEIEKLSAYVLYNKRSVLEASDIELLATKNKEIGDFDFANSILYRNADKAFYILSQYEAQDKSEKEVNLTLAKMIKVFSQLYRISLLAEKGINDKEIAKELKLNEYQTSLYRKSLGSRTSTELENILELCAKADEQIKNGAYRGYVVLSKLIIEAIG